MLATRAPFHNIKCRGKHAFLKVIDLFWKLLWCPLHVFPVTLQVSGKLCISLLFCARTTPSTGTCLESDFGVIIGVIIVATQRKKRCVASCKIKFTCNTPFCNCNCCVASSKKSRTTLYFSQRCETSCLRVTSPQQLATQFCQNGPVRAHLSLAGDFKMRPPSCLLLYALQVAKKVANVWHPICNLKGFLFVIVVLRVARKLLSSCNRPV